MRMTKMLLMLSWSYAIINLVNGLPDGAPESACLTLTPLHRRGKGIQSSYPPYQVLPAAGQGRIRLTLGSPQGLSYEGFMIVARDVESGRYVGEFDDLPPSTKFLECTPGLKNSVTHSDSEKKHNLEFEWIAPSNYEGTIIFNSTFAQDYETYWVGVESPRISLLEGSIDVETIPNSGSFTPDRRLTTTLPYYEQPTTSSDSDNKEDELFYEGCGKTKNCFGSPPGCVSDKTCTAAVSVYVQGEQYIFELIGRGTKYVAVGLSSDNKMGSDSVVECTNEGSVVGLHMSWNDGRKNQRIPTPQGAVQMLDSSFHDDIMRCKFLRAKETLVTNRMYNLETTPYILLLAAGSSVNTQSIGYHDILRESASEPKFLADVGELRTASDLLIRLHGALMLASWIGTASVGILLARYYKQTWVNSQLCGKDQWFAVSLFIKDYLVVTCAVCVLASIITVPSQWHRFFMVLTWAMTLASFVIIFVEIGVWSTATIHASLGLATTILCFIQPFMAAIRPNPGTSKRALFNWAHWFVGNAAHICAIVAIFFAVRLTKAKLPTWFDWILVAYVVVHVLTHLVLTFAGCALEMQDSQRINAFPMKDMHPRGSMGHPDARRDAPRSGLRQSIFGIYLVGISVLSIALIVITVLAPIEASWATITDMIKNY